MMLSLKNETTTIRLSCKEDVPALKEMWKTCFGDKDEDIEAFFEKAYRESATTLVCIEDEKPVAMLTMIPALLHSPLGSVKGNYIYAVATLPQYRGKGYMRELENECCRIALQAGKSFCLLVPAEKPLFEMYRKLGYDTFSSITTISLKSSVPCSGIAILDCDYETFRNLRKKYLATFSKVVQFEKEYEKYAFDEYLRTGGYIFKINEGYVCAYSLENVLRITESSLSISVIESILPDLLQYTKTQKVEMRKPGSQPFSMIKWLDSKLVDYSLSKDISNHYFGFALE